MPVLLAYWIVIAIWSTTPLGIATSNHSLTFWSAAVSRMLLALAILLPLAALRSAPFIPNRRALYAYCLAAVAFGPQMSLGYWAAQYVPTGVMSLVFALTPCLTCIASWLILRDAHLTLKRGIALLVAVTGIGVIYQDQMAISSEAGWGIAALLLSTTIFAVCSVAIKRVTEDMELDPVCHAAGTLLFSTPIMVIAWFVFDGHLPEAVSIESGVAVVYLAVFGSVIGFTAYLYVLRNMNVVTVSLITLIAPVFAILIGVLWVGERFSTSLLLGASMVLTSLLVFEGIVEKLYKYLWAKLKRNSSITGLSSARSQPVLNSQTDLIRSGLTKP